MQEVEQTMQAILCSTPVDFADHHFQTQSLDAASSQPPPMKSIHVVHLSSIIM